MKYTIVFSSLLALTSALVPLPIEERQAVQVSRNDLTTGACRRVTVIFGRGSGQPGNVGSIVGPPFFDALVSRLGASNVAIQGVNYPASYEEAAAGGSKEGTANLVSFAQLASSKCPNTQIILSGYSQGAQLIHLAGPSLTSVASKIAAVVVFGDPYNNQAISNISPSKVRSFCANGDFICNRNGGFDPNAHTSYGKNAAEAAAFVLSKIT
ncbi:cutinase [Leptodontidium sp. 2 PMI_412]|nr:cutinase [Leptodontidium sp. 2 PMI_412]